MSFSQKTKNELARIFPQENCCLLAELAAIVRMDGSVHLVKGKYFFLILETENAAAARKIYFIMKKYLYFKGEVSVRRNTKLKKNNIYTVKIYLQPSANEKLKKIGILISNSNCKTHWDSKIVEKTCCKKAYLRGAFLGGGSISNPEQKTYHLELTTDDNINCKIIVDLMKSYQLSPKVIQRKLSKVIYLKDSEMIVDFLNIIGAHASLLYFEDVRVRKDVRNNVNRIVNCETANLSKSVDAGLKQVATIRFLERNIGLDNIPQKLREVALIRLESPEISLKELGELLDPPLSKSGVNHRMRRLQQLAKKLKGGKNR